MEFSNKKLQKAFTCFENEKYDEALKICNKVLDKDYNNEEALTLEGEILYKLDRIDDAIITWKINSEYNNNALAKRHLESLDNNVRKMALSYTSIYSENEEYRRLVIDAYKESTKDDEIKDENLGEEIKASIIESREREDEPSLFELEAKKIKDEEDAQAKKQAEVIANNAKKEAEVKAHAAQIAKEKAKQEADAKAKEEAILKAKQEADAKAKEEAILKAKQEADAKAKEEAILKAKQEADAKAKEEADAKAREEIVSSTPNQSDKISSKASTSTKSKVNSNTSFNKKIVAIVVAAAIVVVGGIGIYKATTSGNGESSKVEASNVDWTNFNTSMQSAITGNNFNEVYTLLSKSPESEVPAAQKTEYATGLTFMQDNGIQAFYDQGMTDFTNKNYQSAIDNFQKALKFVGDNYLAPHLTYFIGASYSELGEHDKAVEYYKLYLKNFPNANIYNSGCLYVLAKYYYTQGNIPEAQTYAKQLQSQFPNSEYNNNDIQTILNAK